MNLTDENYHMFNKEAFMKCKKHPIIVNEGRGPLICDEDLVWALDNGYIRGAALDMVESEDPDLDTCPLVGRDDVLLTPHIAGTTVDAIPRAPFLLMREVDRFLADGVTDRVVNQASITLE